VLLHGGCEEVRCLTLDGRIDVVGFEAVRGDWCELAQEVQTKVIEIILTKKDVQAAVNYVRDVISKVRAGKVDMKKLVVWKTCCLRSGPET
jgi:DNA polymerase I